jgi:hypothetical protein
MMNPIRFPLTVLSSLLLLAPVALLASCATPGSSSGPGFIYTDHYEGVLVTGNPAGRKRGQACTSNFMGWVTSGDATISAAMKNGSITTVSSVDHYYHSVMGVVGKMCTIVTGN